MFAGWSQHRMSLTSAILALGMPLIFATATAIASENASSAAIVQRLPPVSPTAPFVLPAKPTDLSAPSPGRGRGTSPLIFGDSFGKKMDEVTDEAPPSGTQSVAYSAMEAAQTTLSQTYYAGADYLFIRPQMSEPAAFLFGHGDNGSANAMLNTFDFNYQSSPRVFLGYRSPTTGSGIQFTYWHFQENANSNFNATTQNSGFIPDVNFIWFLIGQNNNNNGPDFGNQVNAQMHLRFNVFDIDLYKPVAFSGGRWLLTGSLGARIMDFSQSTTTLCYDNGASSFNQYQTNSFTGAGPRLALEARRNVGAWSALYVRGGYGILLGGHSGSYVANDLVNVNTITVNENLARMVTVADIEFGASWRATERWALSAGYMFQVWTNLASTGGLVALSDTSNILSFDGLVARASMQF